MPPARAPEYRRRLLLRNLAAQLHQHAALAAASSTAAGGSGGGGRAELAAGAALHHPDAVYAAVRAMYTSLQNMEGACPFENAGGSQLPDCVIDAVRDYMLGSYVQLGATTPMSIKATRTVSSAREFANTFVGGDGIGECYLGASATACITALREAYCRVLKPGDVVVVEEASHEANIGVWMQLEQRCPGVKAVVWPVVADDAAESNLDVLRDILEAEPLGAVKLVAVCHVSNLLGQILDLDRVCELSHAAGAKVPRPPHRPAPPPLQPPLQPPCNRLPVLAGRSCATGWRMPRTG